MTVEGATTEIQTASTSASSTSLTIFTGREFRGCALRLEALLLKQLGEHGPGELIALRSRRQAIDAPGRRRDGWRRMLGNHLVRRELGFRWRTGTEVFDDVAYALLDGIALFSVQRFALVVSLGGSNDG